MMRVQRDRQGPETRRRTNRACTPLEPRGMHAVAGAIDRQAGNALMALHEIEGLLLQARVDRARERRVAPKTADVGRVATHETHRHFGVARCGLDVLPGTREYGDFGRLFAIGRQCAQCAGHETLGPTIGVVARPNQSNLHESDFK